MNKRTGVTLLMVSFLTLGLLSIAESEAGANNFTVSHWLAKFIEQDSRSFTSYHWVSREDLGVNLEGQLDLGDPRISNRLTTLSARYFQTLNHGLYLGTDPVYWSGIGENHFLLYRLKLPGQLLWLNFDAHYDQPGFNSISQDARNTLVQHGCLVGEEDDWEDLFRGNGYNREKNPECAQIVFDTVIELKVDGIKYRKSSANFDGCTSGKREEFAMVLFRLDHVPLQETAIFYREMNDPNLHNEQVQIEQLFLRTLPREEGWLDAILKHRPWPELDEEAKKASPSVLFTEILGCQKSDTLAKSHL